MNILWDSGCFLKRTHSVTQRRVFCPKHLRGSRDTELATPIYVVEESAARSECGETKKHESLYSVSAC